MKTLTPFKPVWFSAALASALSFSAQAALIANGGFESGLASWTRLDQIGSDGTYYLQTGTLSPLNAFAVPAPPEGTAAAMTDAFGPGSHLLYQDFAVPFGLPSASIGFSLFINNGNGSPSFFTPATLDFATPALNQRARVDIMSTSADPFSLAAADVFQNLFQTATADPLVSGYTSFLIDVTSLLQAHQGETLRLRFAEVDNVAPFNMGVDNVDITVVPEPSPLTIMFAAIPVIMGLALRRRGKSGNSIPEGH